MTDLENDHSIVDEAEKEYNVAFQNFLLGCVCSENPNLEKKRLMICPKFGEPVKEGYQNFESLLYRVYKGDTSGINFDVGSEYKQSRAWFIRGLSEEGFICMEGKFYLFFKSQAMATNIGNLLGFPVSDSGNRNRIILENTNQIDFAHDIVFNTNLESRCVVEDYCRRFLASRAHEYPKTLDCGIRTIIPGAVFPTKAHGSDAAWDLSAISVHKQLGPRTWMLETGLCLEPFPGWFAFILPRSSLATRGFMIPNSPGLVDTSYRGTLKILVHLFEPDMVKSYIPGQVEFPIPFPAKIAQLMFMKPNYAIMPVRIDEFGFGTNRDTGGFGSSGN